MEKILLHFKEAALHGCISQASGKLGMTQPALSKSIKLLEQRYNTPLLNRQARGVVLTPAGRVVLERALRIEHEMKGISQDIESLFNKQEELSVGAGPAWEMPINAMISRFFLEYPNIHLSIQSDTITKLLPKLLDNELDLALGGENGYLISGHEELNFIPLISTQLCIVAKSDHPLARYPELPLEELCRYPWVGYQHSTEMLDQINQYLDNEKLPRLRFTLETQFLEVALTMVEKNDALMCISNTLLDKVRKRNITEIKLSEPIWHFHIGIWTRARCQRRPIVEAFIDEIKAQAELYNLNHK